jgi:glutaredoxin
MTKSILDNKGIEYTYKLSDEIPEFNLTRYIKQARIAGLMNFPMIIKDDEIITLQEIVK